MRRLLPACVRLITVAWRQHTGKTVTAVALMLCGAIAAPLTALALRVFTNDAVAGRAADAAMAGVVVAAAAIAALTFSHFAHIAYFELSELSVMELEAQLIALSNGSPGLAHHEQPHLADKLTIIRQDIQRVRMALQSLLALAGLAIALGTTSVVLATLSPVLLALLPLTVPPLVAGGWAERITDRARVASAQDNRLALGIFGLATEAGPAKELRVFRLEGTLLRRHRTLWARATRRLWHAELAGAMLRAGGQLIFAAGYRGAVLLVVREAIVGHRTVGDVVLSITLAAQVNQQLSGAVTMLQELQRMSSTMCHLDEFREAVAGPGEPSGGLPPRRLTHGIEFVDVTFGYPGAGGPVLANVNLSLPAGATVAIVGENGAGKTSLVKLLCGFYRPTSGRVLVDATDLRQISLTLWRTRIAAGFQDFVRFELTAREAIGVGDLPAISSSRAVLGALRRAHASSLLGDLEHGLETQLGRTHADGSELSGGQWQSVALGRAFMRERPLLVILDEPTSALDAATEHGLFQRYAEQARRTAGRTGAITVLVSHRFSTVRMADLIVVVANGSIAEAGDHATLLRSGGLYSELYRMQARAYSQDQQPP